MSGDFYEGNFDREVDFEEINSMFNPNRELIAVRDNYRLFVKSRLGGEFEMRTKPDRSGLFARVQLGEHKRGVLLDLFDDANFGHRIAGMLEKYGDHLPTCQKKDSDWEPDEDDYEDDEEIEPRCTCGFSSVLSIDEANTRRRYA